MKKVLSIILTFAMLISSVTYISVQADTVLSMANVYSDNMVLQAGKPVKLAGYAESGKTVTAVISGGGESYTAAATAVAGNFTVAFDKIFDPSYTEYVLTVSDGTTTLTYNNIVFGDVFLLVGQSNMQYTVQWYGYACNNAGGQEKIDFDNAISTSDNPYLRFVNHENAFDTNWNTPQDNPAITYPWQSMTTTSVNNCSAVGYFLGRQIQEEKNYPVGLICSAIGATQIGQWLPNDGAFIVDYPAACYNTRVYPYRNFNVKSIIWYQGEFDAGNPEPYCAKTVHLIDTYRNLFGNVPFCSVQLPNYGGYGCDGYPAIRKQQFDTFNIFETSAKDAGTQNTVGLISLIDQKYANPYQQNTGLHPEGKREVGLRIAKWADSITYGFGGEYAGPVLSNADIVDGKVVLTFDHVGNGLTTRNNVSQIGDFKIVGEDNNYYDATGTITSSNTVTIATDVVNPKFVEYAQDTVNLNADLMNDAGFAAYPFSPVSLTGEGGVVPPTPTPTPTPLSSPTPTPSTGPVYSSFKIYSNPLSPYNTSGSSYLSASSATAEAQNYSYERTFAKNFNAGDGIVHKPVAGSLDGKNTRIAIGHCAYPTESDLAAVVTYMENGEVKHSPAYRFTGYHSDGKQDKSLGDAWVTSQLDIGTYPNVISVNVYHIIAGGEPMQDYVQFDVVGDAGSVVLPSTGIYVESMVLPYEITGGAASPTPSPSSTPSPTPSIEPTITPSPTPTALPTITPSPTPVPTGEGLVGTSFSIWAGPWANDHNGGSVYGNPVYVGNYSEGSWNWFITEDEWRSGSPEKSYGVALVSQDATKLTYQPNSSYNLNGYKTKLYVENAVMQPGAVYADINFSDGKPTQTIMVYDGGLPFTDFYVKSGHSFDFIIQNIYLGEFENVSNVTLYARSTAAGQGFYVGFGHVTYEVTGLAGGSSNVNEISNINVENGYVTGVDITSTDKLAGKLLVAVYKEDELLAIRLVDVADTVYSESGTALLPVNLQLPSGYTQIKAMLWNNTENIKPLF